MGPDEEKSDFEFLAFLVLYYINKACVKILWQYLKYFSRYGHFIYQPHFLPVTLTFDPKVKLLTNMKILYLARKFFLIGFRI